jgi:hypothetical protein
VPTWIVFVVTFFKNVASAKELNDVSPPGFVYAIILSEVALFVIFAIPLPVWQARHPKHYWNTELVYSILSLTSKTVLNGLILSNVLLASRIE